MKRTIQTPTDNLTGVMFRELSSITERQYFVTDMKHKILITEIKFKLLIMMILKYGNFRHVAVKKSL